MATGCRENGVEGCGSSVFEINIELCCRADRLHGIAEQKLDAHRDHSALECLGNFRIKKAQQTIPAVNKCDPHSQRGEDAGVFAADHSAANDEEAIRKLPDIEDRIGVEKTGIVPRIVSRAVRMRPRSEENRCCSECVGCAIRTLNMHRVGIQQGPDSLECGNTMALHVGVDTGTLLSAHIVEMGEETCGVDALIGIEAEPIEFAFTESRKVERRLAERLRGESACIRRSTTRKWFPLNECDFLSKISRLRSPLLAGWAGADDNEVVVH